MANDFKPFATGPGANVTPQDEYAGLPALASGFQAGKASSAQINKALRQASFIAAALAQYTADKSGEDVLDDGDVSGFIAKMADAFGEDFQPKNDKLTAFSGLVGAANRLPYFTGANALALTALTAVGRDLIGLADVPAILQYLGLGDGSALPVGVPVPWPLATPPAGWLKCNGAAFTAAQYPKLALAYPALTLPDLRGEFIRGWDDGRGVDSGRALLSAQGFAMQNITGSMYARTTAGTSSSVIGYASGALSLSIGTGSSLVDVSRSDTSSNSDVITLDASRVANTATETRPRNIAFNYIVRAA